MQNCVCAAFRSVAPDLRDPDALSGSPALRVTPCGSRSLAAAGASEKSGGQQLSHPRNVKLWRPPRPAAIGPACDVSRSTVTWGLGPLAPRRSGIRRSRRRRLATGTGKGSAASQQAPPRAALRAAARSGVFWLLSRQSYGTLFCSSSLSPRISALLLFLRAPKLDLFVREAGAMALASRRFHEAFVNANNA